jgi:DNA-binding LacI/PurR family transcriptional regulator
LIFPSSPDSPPSWGGLWRGLSSSAKTFERNGDKRFPIFHSINGHPDSEDYQNLLRSLRSKRLAGMIFTWNPYYLMGDPILEERGIPRVALMPPRSDMSVLSVGVDYPAFCDRAVEYLIGRGRKRIASLFYAGLDDNSMPEDRFLLSLQSRGLQYKSHWSQYVNVFHPTAVCRAVQVLFHADQTVRPDSLVVTDDTMLDAVINGLFAVGLSVPRDVEVVAHANFPVKPTAVPVKRLGYDTRKILQTCVRLIDQRRRGEPSAALTEVSPQFENEIEEMVVL